MLPVMRPPPEVELKPPLSPVALPTSRRLPGREAKTRLLWSTTAGLPLLPGAGKGCVCVHTACNNKKRRKKNKRGFKTLELTGGMNRGVCNQRTLVHSSVCVSNRFSRILYGLLYTGRIRGTRGRDKTGTTDLAPLSTCKKNERPYSNPASNACVPENIGAVTKKKALLVRAIKGGYLSYRPLSDPF